MGTSHLEIASYYLKFARVNSTTLIFWRDNFNSNFLSLFIYSMSKHSRKTRNRHFVLSNVFVHLVFLRKSSACFKSFDLLYVTLSIHMFVCLFIKNFNGIRSRYTVVQVSQIKILFCQNTKFFVQSPQFS